MTELRESTFRIVESDTTLESFVFAPSGPGPHPTVMMFPGGTGPGPSFRAAVRELAERGYLAIGIDMYGVDADIGSPRSAGVYFEALMTRPEWLRNRVVAWFEAVSARHDVDARRVSAIGYCFGGKCVLELARSGADLRSATSFHGLLGTHAPARPGAILAHVAIWTGGLDPYAPIEDLDMVRAELNAAGAAHQVTLFATAQHAFTDPDHDGMGPGIAYDRLSHRTAWSGTLALLEHVLA